MPLTGAMVTLDGQAGGPRSDEELVQAVRAKDYDAFSELFRRHRHRALTLALTLVNDESRAADITSEAFAKVLKALIGGAGPSGSFAPYLQATVRNVFIDQYRRERREVLIDDVGQVASMPLIVPDPAQRHAETSVARAAFETLPAHWQNVLWRTQVLEQSLQEVADATGTTANAVGVTVFRAKEGLREAYLAQHLDLAPDGQCPTNLVPRFVRGTLSKRVQAKVEQHVQDCRLCTGLVGSLERINSDLAALLCPALIGYQVIRNPEGKEVVTSSSTVGKFAAGLATLAVCGVVTLLVLADDAPSPTMGSAAASPATTTEQETDPPPASVQDEPRKRGRIKAASPPDGAPAPLAIAPSSPTTSPDAPQPTRAAPSPIVTTVPPSLSSIEVTVVRSASVNLAQVATRIEGVVEEPLSLFLVADNVAGMTPAKGWSCSARSSAAEDRAWRCIRDDPAVGSFTASLEYREPGLAMPGQLGFTDQSQVISFVAPPAVADDATPSSP